MTFNVCSRRSIVVLTIVCLAAEAGLAQRRPSPLPTGSASDAIRSIDDRRDDNEVRSPIRQTDASIKLVGNETDSVTDATAAEVATAAGVANVEAASEAAIEVKGEAIASQLQLALLREEHAEQSAADASEPSPTEDSVSHSAQSAQVDLLKQLDAIVGQQKAARSRLDDLRAEETKTVSRTFDNTGRSGVSSDRLGNDPADTAAAPPSILEVDRWVEQEAGLKIRRKNLENAALAARSAVEAARGIVDQAAREVRMARQEAGDVDLADDDAVVLKLKIAQEMLILRRLESAAEELAAEFIETEWQTVQSRLDASGTGAAMSPEDLATKLGEIESTDAELRRRVATVQTELQFAERRWLSARQDIDRTAMPSVAQKTMLSALKVRQQRFQNEAAILNQRLQRLPALKELWRRRFAVASGKASRQQRSEWLEEIQVSRSEMGRDLESRQLKIEEVRDLASQQREIAESVRQLSDPERTGDKPSLVQSDDQREIRRWARVAASAHEEHLTTLQSSLAALKQHDRLLERLSVQIDGRRGRTPGEWVADGWTTARKAWNYELASVDDHSVTVGKVCSSVLLLFMGYFLAKYLSHVIGNRLPRWGVDEAGAHAIESLSFYIMLIVFALGALRYSSVPLTVFTFLGGAIAIGVGFGSQNILNNFISGLILLAERPIKVGDLIEIDGTYGNIRRIGARSTSIQTGENQDIIVPNSKFLENNVTNLTRKDDRLRTSITIGVAYGSDLDAVLRLLGRAATEQSGVMERPKPMVWFNDFGDNALVFQVHFWIHAKNITQMRMIETGVRLRIDAMFRQANITIAFPQRDLHLSTSEPIDLRVVRPATKQILNESERRAA